MRLTINLSEDLYRVAKSMAVAEDCSISVAVNKLLERGLGGSVPKQRRKVSLLPTVEGRVRFSSEDVYRIDLA